MKLPKHQPDGNFELSDLGDSGRLWLIIPFFINREIHMLWSKRGHFSPSFLLWSLCIRDNLWVSWVWVCTVAIHQWFLLPYCFHPDGLLFRTWRWLCMDKSRAACGNLLRYRVCWYYFCCSSQLCCCQLLCIKTCCVQSWEEFSCGLPLHRD